MGQVFTSSAEMFKHKAEIFDPCANQQREGKKTERKSAGGFINLDLIGGRSQAGETTTTTVPWKPFLFLHMPLSHFYTHFPLVLACFLLL